MRDVKFRKIDWLKSIGLATLLAISCPAHAAEKTTYFHFDALGSPVAASDQAGNVVWKEEYRPYGARIKQEPAAGSNTRWYTGHPHDDDTGLTYAGARYYDPVVGRFMATDPKGFTADNLHSFNRYAYANNNPYKFIDPDGEFGFLAAIPWVLGVISAGATGVEIGSGIYDVASGDKSVGQVAAERAPGLALSRVPGLRTLSKRLPKVGDNAPKYARNKYKPLSQQAKKKVLKENPTCVYCDKKPSTTVDHKRSQKQDWREGGWKDSREVRSTRSNDPSNLTGACSSCNPSKGSKELGTEWIPPKYR